MDATILVDAINKAMRSGAVAAPPIHGQGNDSNFVRAQVDVGIDPAALEAYLADLNADADMAAFEKTFANAPNGGGVSVGLSTIARVLLAQAIVTKDVAGTVARFISAISSNVVDATAVMAVSGIKTDKPIRVGPDVVLLPMSALSPSTQRGMALAQNPLSPLASRIAIPCALTTRFRFGPVFYQPKDPQPAEETAARIPTNGALAILEEAINLLSVIELYPVARMSWIQPDDWLMAAGASAAWSSAGYQEHFGWDVDVPVAEVEALGSAYFAIEQKKRMERLRIPLDRLARAGREPDMADRAIDLGIALESLLLHDTESTSELRFRLSYRGGWLLGNDPDDRLKAQGQLRKAYDLRSRAAHTGVVERTEKNIAAVKCAAEVCRTIVRRTIELGGVIDFERLIVGGDAQTRRRGPT